MIYKFFDKKSSSSRIKNENISNKAEELSKPINRKFKKSKVHLPFIDNILGANLVDMQLISKFNKRFRFLICVIEQICMGYSFKDKKGITIISAFQKILKDLLEP